MARSDIDTIAVSSGDRFFGASTAYGYQTSIWLGRLRLHVFHREDPGEAFHDHPWDFATFPLTAYVEEVLDVETGAISRQVVPAGKVSFRPGEHAHRVIGPWSGARRDGVPTVRPGKIVTLVKRGPVRRDWHYFNVKAGKVHRLPWRRYLRIADKG